MKELETADKMVRRWEEEEVARKAVYNFRKDNLLADIECLVARVEDMKQLVAEGKYDHERAFDMVAAQVERVAEARDVFISEIK